MDENGGIFEVEVVKLKKSLRLITDKDIKTAIQNDIKWAEENKNDYIQYYCY